MKKILLILVLFAFGFSLNAQNLSDAAVMQLVAQNATAIGLKGDQAKNLKLSSTYTDAGTQYVYLLQTYKGVPIFNQMLVLAFKDNNLISHAGTLLTDLEKNSQSANPSVMASSAIGAAFTAADLAPPASAVVVSTKDNGRSLDFGKLPGVSENVTAELMWIPSQKDQSLSLAWAVQVIPAKKSDAWLMQIDAVTNTLLDKVSLTIYEQKKGDYTGGGILANKDLNFLGDGSKLFFNPPPPPTVTSGDYRVVAYPKENPLQGVTVVTSPWLNAGVGNNAVTNGWHFDGTTNYDITRGNNVHAYLDVDNNNTPNQAGNNFSAQSTTANPALTFNFTPDFTQDPSVIGNKNAAVTNLFYVNNIVHDIMYQYGFTESAGNFQADNLGRGGLGGDYVQAEADDASGLNNANFSVVPDGVRGRMQMYLFNAVSSVILKVNTPAGIAGNYLAVESGFSTANKLSVVGPITAPVVYFNDAAGGTHDACTGAPANSLTGKIALINRGNCAYTVKVKEAQNAGAVAVIMVNSASGPPFVMGGTDNTITIPAVMVTDAYGAAFAAQLANNLNVTLSATTQRLDGDLDNGIIYHEFAHGLSTRLTGGPANPNCLNNAEEGGEGWSDYSALMLTTDWATATVNDGTIPRSMGGYVISGGIRAFPYSTNMAINPWTYSGVQTSGGEVHDIGEIWCATLWDMTWAIIQQENAINPNLYSYTAAGTGGNSIALKLVLEGMKLQPCSPGFLDARNAILQADLNLYAGRHYCTIWNAFARRGMGWSAVQGSSDNTNDQVQAFDVPPAATLTKQPASTTVCLGTPVTFTTTVTNIPSAPAVTYKWQVSTNNGGTWTDIVPAVTGTSYTFTPTVADNGNQYRLVVTGACGSVNSNAATLTVTTVTTGGTLSPAATNNVCAGAAGNTTTLTLSGQVGNILQWEYSTDGGVTFPNIVANTATTLTVTNLTASRVYRVKVQSTGCAVQYSSNATINVVAGVGSLSISANQGTTLCQGDPTLLTAGGLITNTFNSACGTINIPSVGAATPYPCTINVVGLPTTGVSVQSVTINDVTHTFPDDIDIILQSPTGTNVVLMSDVGGSTDINNVSYTFSDDAAALMADGGFNPSGIYKPTNFVVPDTWVAPGPGAITQANPALSMFTGDPNGIWKLFVVDDAGGDLGSISNFSITFGTIGIVPGLTYTWTPATGLNNTTGNPVAASPAISTTYTVTATNAAGCTGSASIPITVNTRPAFTAQPVAATACVGGDATFSVAATGTGVTYQWQVSTDNCTTYANIAGATTNTLVVPAVTLAMAGNGYRCVISGTCPPSVNSNCAKLNVNALPTVTVTPSSGCGGIAGINGLQLTTGGQASPPPIPGSKTFTSTTAVAVPDNTATGASSVLNVTGIPTNATVTNVTVTLNMSHTYPGDMIFNLKGANGVIANLYKYNNGLFTGPIPGPATWGWYGAQVSGNGTDPFSSVATAPFVYGTNPVFRPDLKNTTGLTVQNPVGFASTATAFNQLYTPAITTAINGNWTLAMADGAAGDVGTLTGWSLKIDYTTPDPATPPITYTWSPAAGLYTDPTATTPYITGATTPTVYAAPTVYTPYTVTAVGTATGCINTATAFINYTPPAPAITPNPTAICLNGPAVKLTNSSAIPVTVKTFKSAALNLIIPDNNPAGVTTTIDVTGIPANVTVTKMNVKLNISHTWSGDMIVALKSPNNGTVNLDYKLGGTGKGPSATGFVNTVISSSGGAALSSGVDPYTDIYAADGAPATNNPSPSPTGMTVTTTRFKDLLSPAAGVNGTYTLGLKDAGLGDIGKLTSWEIEITYINGVPSTPAEWTPATGLFTDAASTIPYVAGTQVDSVWANPSATTTYNVTVTSLATPTQAVKSNLTVTTFANLVTFNFKNNNTFPVIIKGLNSVLFDAGLTAVVGAYYKTSAINGLPGAISAANGWLPMGSRNIIGNGTFSEQPFISGLAITVPAGATYGIAVQAYDAFGGDLVFSNAVNTLTTFTAGGCSIITGPNIGYAGVANAPAAPAFTPYGFVGSVSFMPDIQCTSPSRSVTVTVNTPLSITTHPKDTKGCIGQSVQFSTAVTGSVPGHNWQVAIPPAPGAPRVWTNLSNNTTYSGVNTATLTVSNIASAMNLYAYRDSIAAGGVCGAQISSFGVLTVNPLPVVTIEPVTLSKLLPGLKTTLTAVSNPAASANGYSWFRNGVLVPGVTTNTYLVDIDHLGEYTAKVTDVNGCSSAVPSNAVTIADSASGRVFIYPTPNGGQFQVRYYSALYNTNIPRGINVYDARGKRVLTQTYSIASPFQRMDVDLRKYGTGVYWIEVVDVAGNRLAMGRTEVLK